MTEKSYGGDNGVKNQGKIVKTKLDSKTKIKKAKEERPASKEVKGELNLELESYIKAGEIAKKTTEFAKKLIKPGMSLLEIAKKIEEEIVKLGGEIGFPVNLSIDDVAAHYHPTIEETRKAEGLLKVDIGVSVNGYIADTAFSLDLTEDKKYKELIEASENALSSALELLEKDPTLHEIGQAIQKEIEKKGFSPIVNLSGHELGQYKVHAGITIPNCGNNNQNKIEPGAYAIEPFATTGEGKVYDGVSSNIFSITDYKTPRGQTARKILEYVWNKYKTLPFSLREIQEKFGALARLGIKELEQSGIVHNFPQLVERARKPVSQAEHSFIKTPDGKIIVTTR